MDQNRPCKLYSAERNIIYSRTVPSMFRETEREKKEERMGREGWFCCLVHEGKAEVRRTDKEHEAHQLQLSEDGSVHVCVHTCVQLKSHSSKWWKISVFTLSSEMLFESAYWEAYNTWSKKNPGAAVIVYKFIGM